MAQNKIHNGMKRILTILALLVGLAGNSQYINGDGYTIWKGNMYIGHPRTGSITVPISSVHLQLGDSATTKALWLPRVQDTGNISSPRQGMEIYRISDGRPYWRDLYKWYTFAVDAAQAVGDTTSFVWHKGGDYFPFVPIDNPPSIGTISEDDLTFITSDQTRFKILSSGIPYSNASDDSLIGINTNLELVKVPKTSGALTSVGLAMPSGFTVSNSPLTSNGTITVAGAGNYWHYINGLGQLRTFRQGQKDTGYLWMSGVTIYTAITHSFGNVGTGQYPNKVADTLGLTLDNEADPGTGLYGAIRHVWTGNYLNPARNNLISQMNLEVEAFAFNPSDPQLVYNRIRGMAKVFFANCFLKSAIPMSDASVTKSGFGNATVNFANKSASIGGTLQVSTVVASTASFTATIANTKERIVIGYHSSERGKVVGGFTVTVDGSSNITTVVTSGVYAKDTLYTILDEVGIEVYPDCIIIGGGSSSGLSVGSHTISIQSTTNDSTFLDYWGIMASPDSCKPVVGVMATHLDVDNRMNTTLGMRPYYNEYCDNINTAYFDAANDYFGSYPLSITDPNKYFDPSTCLLGYSNPVHPNPTGGSAIAKAILDAVRVKKIDKADYRLPVGSIINGYLESPQVAYGSGYRSITGKSTFIFDGATEDRLYVPKITAAAGTMTDQLTPWDFTATMPTVITGNNYGARFRITSAGSSNQFFLGSV
jgi:hypothetical protein